MNTPATSREAILEVCRKMVSEHGLTAVDMRSVAKCVQCGIRFIVQLLPQQG